MGAASDDPTICTGDTGRPVGRPYVVLSVTPHLGVYQSATNSPSFAHGGAGTQSFPSVPRRTITDIHQVTCHGQLYNKLRQIKKHYGATNDHP
jgi:hypothetical protein